MGKERKRRKTYTGARVAVIFLLIAFSVGGYIGYDYYQAIFGKNVDLGKKSPGFFYVPSNATYEGVLDSLRQKGWIEDFSSLKWVAEKKNYSAHVHPGRYKIKDGMSNNELMDLLRSGKQVPVDVTFNDIRTYEQLAGEASRNLELDSTTLVEELTNPRTAKTYGFDSATFMAMFLPNTYEFYWDTGTKGFFDRMRKEYERFWSKERKQKAKRIGLNPVEVSILASIVEEEQLKHPEERDEVAGLFVNRLQKGMKLESDPTLKYAMGDFTVKRVLNKDKDIDSPYNTYKNKGLPPGPIRIPSTSSIKAVLDHADHDYLFMCAKPDSSGLHNFAETYRQHLENARKYQQWLNKKDIMR